jgi:peptide-methionine (R)-S-oxide reductase
MSDDNQWREKLTAEEYRICREKGTEPPFSGELGDNKRSGRYLCKCCGEALFSSETKFDSGSGWPSFDNPATEDVIRYHTDKTLGMIRVEVMCDKCGSHLGHMFEDGPRETTGKRYCVNSLSLDFKEE